MGIEKSYRNLESRYSVAEVANVLRKFYGLIQPASRELGCSRGALYRFIDRHPEAKKIVEEGRDELLDSAESVLVRILNGNISASAGERLEAAKYVTSTIGKKRGYTTRTETELTGKDGAPLAPLTVTISPEIYDEKNDGKPAGGH